jgi:hypothetical protein
LKTRIEPLQAAFEKEQRQGSTALFPIRLDSAVMDRSRAWEPDEGPAEAERVAKKMFA